MEIRDDLIWIYVMNTRETYDILQDVIEVVTKDRMDDIEISRESIKKGSGVRSVMFLALLMIDKYSNARTSPEGRDIAVENIVDYIMECVEYNLKYLKDE